MALNNTINMFKSDKSDLLKEALRGSIYSHKPCEDEFVETISLDSFDCDKIKEHVKTSSNLLNYNVTHKPIILEILETLQKNKDEFIVDKYKHTGFYWNGVPIFRVNLTTDDVQTTRELHISLHRYNSEKSSIGSEKKIQNMLIYGLVGSLIIGAGVTMAAIFKPND
jgi:hypothetical protein